MFAKKFLQKNKWYEFSYSDGNGELSMFAQFKRYERIGQTIFAYVFHANNEQHALINTETINRIEAVMPMYRTTKQTN